MVDAIRCTPHRATREVAELATNTTVARIWHGWTTVDNADAYQSVVDGEVFPAIFERRIPGLVSAQLMRADDVIDGEVEFTTIIWFESLDSVKSFMGVDYRQAHMPDNARAVLKRFDAEAKHFHLFGEFG
jgi:heme-degrading monooxygenase HmoA